MCEAHPKAPSVRLSRKGKSAEDCRWRIVEERGVSKRLRRNWQSICTGSSRSHFCSEVTNGLPKNNEDDQSALCVTCHQLLKSGAIFLVCVRNIKSYHDLLRASMNLPKTDQPLELNRRRQAVWRYPEMLNFVAWRLKQYVNSGRMVADDFERAVNPDYDQVHL